MNVLYVTLNSSLRSTTCVIDAVVKQMRPNGLKPFFVFKDKGPWANVLQKNGICCYYKDFIVPSKSRPIEFMTNFVFWFRLIKKHKIDILHMNEHDYYPMVKHAAKAAGVKVVVGVRFVLNGGYAKWAFKPPYTPDKLLFTSHDQLERSRAELPANVESHAVDVFGNGRDLDELTSSLFHEGQATWKCKGGNTVVIGTASSLRPRKRIEDFILLIKELLDSGHNVHGIIAGGGKYADPEYVVMLEKLILENGLSSKIEMIGNLDEMAPFYHSIDLFVSTSELETFGMSVCEAMAFGLPVAAYEGGSVQEVLSDDKYIVPNLEFRRLVDLVSDMVENLENHRNYATRHKSRVFENFNAPTLSCRLNDTYKELL